MTRRCPNGGPPLLLVSRWQQDHVVTTSRFMHWWSIVPSVVIARWCVGCTRLGSSFFL